MKMHKQTRRSITVVPIAERGLWKKSSP